MKQPIIADEQIDEILDNEKRPRGARAKGVISNIATTGKRAVLSIYDEISWWTGNDARTFRETLKAVDADVIELRLNSPGGGVFEGVAIYNMLLAHPAQVEVHIDGLAASIASVIAMAGDEIHIAENAMMMIHNPWVSTRGGAEQLRKTADILDKVKDAILNTYENVSTLSRDEISAAMAAETYYGADDAIAAGFATHKTEALKVAALWDATEFAAFLPEAAAAFGRKREESPPEPQLVGTLDDVEAARLRIAEIAARYGL